MPGKTAILTGATGTLGRKIAQRLAANSVNLVLTGRDEVALRALSESIAGINSSIKIGYISENLANEAAINHILDYAQQFGGFDILINNAAILGPVGRSWEISTEDFESVFRLDFLAPAALCRAALPMLIARGAGWIVNLSGGGATSPRPTVSAYGAAKTALVRLGETLAMECAPYAVRVNSVAPGAFKSKMTQDIITAKAADDAETTLAERLLMQDSEAADRASALIAYLVAGDGVDITGKIISAVWDDWADFHKAPIAPDSYTLRRITPA